ncbi:hypothetical protein BwSH20_75930 [Bradyrhizobium ottawaense]|nr:hypothetical protein BJA01nite_81380 [Bradyrhizobium japonicum]GMO10836.1 hypothetical protein BwSH20_75930 [Bradyrhizobium ottawaense]GMO52224.1 hypothetical protein BwSF21_75550 [Bradyrhizobium ottawaense]GMO53544.1 hypothetical protein BwSH14_76960 [Bradyrhizobium ottawaense]GMO53653.1 hypothetical protein BwSF12_65530 [Bradyrhizobium ottawaense]
MKAQIGGMLGGPTMASQTIKGLLDQIAVFSACRGISPRAKGEWLKASLRARAKHMGC